jgi:NADPH2:quinone reductase
MNAEAMPAGQRVIVSRFAETPLEAVDGEMQLVDVPAPDVASLGPRDVVVAVKSAAVGWVDLLMTSGQYQHMPKPPYTPGLECAGVVAWKGAEVGEAIAIGEAVLVDGFLAGPRSVGGYQASGGFASYVVAPADAVIRVPGKLSLDQAAGLLGAYETAYHALIARGRLSAGETVLILGASGSTGLAAVHVAKLVGANVIAVGRSEAKLARVREAGADHVISCANADGSPGVRPFRDDVKAITKGRRVDVIWDGVGGDVSIEAMHCARFAARFLIVGWASTPFVAKGQGQRGAPNVNTLPTNLMMMKQLDVLGCPTVIATVQDPSIRAPRLAQVLAWAESGAIAPVVSHRFPLSDFRAAMRAKWSGEVFGNAVLNP